MPFAMNEATRFISPTKTPEFLAAGMPVVSTPIRDVVHPYGDRGLVEIAADSARGLRRCERVMRRDARRAGAPTPIAYLAEQSWDAPGDRCAG